MKSTNCFIPNESSMQPLANSIVSACQPGTTITLSGDLGAGKTTLARCILRALGYQGIVKSPTYTLIETYEVADWQITHIDLYRLNDPTEIEYLGLYEYLNGKFLCLIEWPEKGYEHLPQCDLGVTINYHAQGRHIQLVGVTDKGELLF